MSVVYAREDNLSLDEYLDLLERSTLAQRRPVHDRAAMEGALRGSSIVLTARQDGVLVGAARAVTDFHLACYLADLAVDAAAQGTGIGLALQRELRDHLAVGCKISLTAAPAAAEYYPRIGYEPNDRAWVLPPEAPLG
ncbi:GNAT family N-acetyltransferase [Demequina sp.]|uniref:GNAT family N-acetyltransferase n=1 Tax=Demequina sp. TaxID=2050685 RepID=UPI003A87C70F